MGQANNIFSDTQHNLNKSRLLLWGGTGCNQHFQDFQRAKWPHGFNYPKLLWDKMQGSVMNNNFDTQPEGNIWNLSWDIWIKFTRWSETWYQIRWLFLFTPLVLWPKMKPNTLQGSLLLHASLKIQHVVLDSFCTKWLNNTKKKKKR